MSQAIAPGHYLKPIDPRDKPRALAKALAKWGWPIMCYLALALLVTLYMMQQLQFSSRMSLVLPGTGHSSNFNLEDVGQASAQTKSAYSGAGFSPRVNYKQIITSREVITQAAAMMGIDAKSFKAPKVKLLQQTSIIQVEITGETPEYAQSKASALYEAFQNRLTQLRQDETERHYDSVVSVLDQYRDRLTRARNAVIEFQQRSALISSDQWVAVTAQLSELQQKQIYVGAEVKSRGDYVRQLGLDLRISSALAGQAFALQSDTLFQSYMKELNAASSQLSEYRSRWGEKHPKVQSSDKRFKKAKALLMQRSKQVVGIQAAEALYEMSLQISPDRARLFADLVESYALYQGKKAELADLSQAEFKLQHTLRVYSREMVELERLEREVQLAEAVYTSAAAKMDASKSDVFASYPVVQLLSPPTQPLEPKNPNPKIAVAIAAGGFLFITLGLLVLWQRERITRLLLKKS